LAGTEEKLFWHSTLQDQTDSLVLDYPAIAPLFYPDHIWHLTGFDDLPTMAARIVTLRAGNPDIKIGKYHSSCTSIPTTEEPYNHTSFVYNENIQDSWICRYADDSYVEWGGSWTDRYFLDITQDVVREAIISSAVAAAQAYDYDHISFDNCTYNYRLVPGGEEVISIEDRNAAFADLFDEAVAAAHAVGLDVHINVATRASDIPECLAAIASKVDGILFELSFHSSLSQAQWDAEAAAYASAAAGGTMVLIYNKEGSDHGLNVLEQARDIVRQWENIYVSDGEYYLEYFKHGTNSYDYENAPALEMWYRGYTG
jgi:hypothetical protein